MIRQKLGLDTSKTKQQKTSEKSQTYENSCGSLGLSTERDLIGNLLTPEEQSMEEEMSPKDFSLSIEDSLRIKSVHD